MLSITHAQEPRFKMSYLGSILANRNPYLTSKCKARIQDNRCAPRLIHWGGRCWPCGYIQFMFDFKNYIIKIMS